MLKFFLIPVEVWYYVVLPILLILLIYLVFSLLYRKKKGTYYYDYVMDYVYSTLGVLFCSFLLCLLLGYAIATLQILYTTGVLMNVFLLAIIIIILPIIPACCLVYVMSVYIKNLKRKERLDDALYEREYELKRKKDE